MMQGEFEASKAIYSVSPEFFPLPVATGKFSGGSNEYFYICEFVEMQDSRLNIRDFCGNLAKLHKNGKSPNGMFGFHITTCNGWIPQLNDWEESWMTFFQKGFIHLLEMDKKLHESILDKDRDTFLNVVIPRLLLPLNISPCLIHGDLWYGNTSTTREYRPIIFDAAAFYAHNEYELGNWRHPRNKFEACIKEYQSHFPISQPEEEFDDRNRLYAT